MREVYLRALDDVLAALDMRYDPYDYETAYGYSLAMDEVKQLKKDITKEVGE